MTVVRKVSLELPALANLETWPRRLDAVLFLLLTFLVAGTLVGARDFSHLNISLGATPLFVTEAFLTIWVIARVGRTVEILRAVPRAMAVAALVYLIVGTIELARSLPGHHPVANILRDFAVFYYAAFLFVGVDLLRSRLTSDILLQLVAASSFAVTGIGVINLFQHRALEVTTSGSVRSLSITYGMYLIMAAVAASTALSLGWRPTSFYALVVVTSVVGLALTQSRSIMLALPLGLVIWVAARWPQSRRLLFLIAGCTLAVTVIAFLVSLSPLASSAGCIVCSRIRSFSHLATDPNASWRLHMWQAALGYVISHPIAGMGFGHLNLLPTGGAPHNSVITIAFVSGIPGLLAFLAVNVVFYWLCVQTFRSRPDLHTRALIASALTWQIVTLEVSFFNVGLEGPFIGMFYWLSMGLGLAAIGNILVKPLREPRD